MREAVVYCYLLHRIVAKYVEEPVRSNLSAGSTTFTEKLFNHCEYIKRGVCYKKYREVQLNLTIEVFH